MLHYLYSIINKINQKIYIGQTIDSSRRWAAHKNFSKNPEKTGQYIHRAMAKYGVDNFQFEIIASSQTQADADETETLLIKQYDSRNKEKGYNIKSGGETWDDETKKHMSEKMKQHYVDYPEDRERVSIQAKIQWQNCEYVDKMKNLPHPNKMKGQRISEEQRNNILKGVKYLKGVKRAPLSDEIKNKISDTKRNLPEDIKRDITNRITLSRGQVVLSEKQRQMIINDSRSSYLLAKEYGVNASTIQRIKKKARL